MTPGTEIHGRRPAPAARWRLLAPALEVAVFEEVGERVLPRVPPLVDRLRDVLGRLPAIPGEMREHRRPDVVGFRLVEGAEKLPVADAAELEGVGRALDELRLDAE